VSLGAQSWVRYALNKKSQHDAATVTVVDVLKGRVLLRKRVTREKDMVLTATYKSTFLMRLDFDDGTVSWQYFQSGM